jgi:hypothetical protein
VEIARGIEVPLVADPVLGPEVQYAAVGSNHKITCIVFPLFKEEDYVGRITFEGFDAIRCCRGECMPYKRDWVKKENSRYPWVFEVDNSSWLQERHDYESRYYKTPLLDEYIHYLFSFHDEFVELIAQGIWLEKIKYSQVNTAPSSDHPLTELPDGLPSEDFVVDRIRCLVRCNPLPTKDLIERSRLCSQSLFQYFLMLDGEITPSYEARLRTIRGTSMTRLQGGLFSEDLLIVQGIGQEAEARKTFAQYVSEVAKRRRQMGRT